MGSSPSNLGRRRLRAWMVAAAAAAIVAWAFEFSSHLHPVDKPQSSGQTVEFCGFCAVFQLGSGPVAIALYVSHPQLAEPAANILLAAPASTLQLSYRSRAPPPI